MSAMAESNETRSLQGHLLVATPELLDPNFFQSVVLLVRHDGEEGALGLVLNRPTETTIKDAWEQVSELPCGCDEPIHRGGPCEGPLMVLHTQEAAGQIPVCSGLYFSAEQDKVEWLIEHDVRPIRFFVGYAGWAPGQLEEELKSGSWLICPQVKEFVFRTPEDLWELVMASIRREEGIPFVDPRLMPRDPRMN
jgi:putative transcriptional regulator